MNPKFTIRYRCSEVTGPMEQVHCCTLEEFERKLFGLLNKFGDTIRFESASMEEAA